MTLFTLPYIKLVLTGSSFPGVRKHCEVALTPGGELTLFGAIITAKEVNLTLYWS